MPREKMSKYFDTMSFCYKEPRGIVELTRRQFRWYLKKLNQEVLVKDLERLNELIREFDQIPQRELAKNDPYWEIQEMHNLAHKLAQAEIRLRGNRVARDNPPIPC